MTITVKSSQTDTHRQTGAYPELHRKVQQIRSAFWARAGRETAAPPDLVRLDLSSADGAMDSHALARFVDAVPRGALLSIQGKDVLTSLHFEEVLIAADRHDIETEVVTDGTGLEDSAPALYGLGIGTVRLTLHGPEEIHNAIVGSATAFEETARGALSLKGLCSGGPRPRLVVEIPISAANHSRLAETAEIAVAIAADKVVILHELSPKANAAVRPAVVAGEAKVIAEKWRSRQVSFFPNLVGADLEALYLDGARKVLSHRCTAPWRSVNVASDGSVYLCDRLVGELSDGDFMSAYNGKAARAFRRQVRGAVLPSCVGCYGRFGKEEQTK